MRNILLTLSLMLFAGNAFAAEEPEWFLNAIKKDNPNDLAYSTLTNDKCPVTEAEMQSIVEGVFIRSRVKPINSRNSGLRLSVSLHCYIGKNINPVYAIELKFGLYSPKPAVLYDYPFGGFGIRDKDGITQTLKSMVENAMTAYIKANFDL